MSDQEDRKRADSMLLPAGKTCGDCARLDHCVWLFGCAPGNTKCDWSPSRFKPILVGPSGIPSSTTHDYSNGSRKAVACDRCKAPFPAPMRVYGEALCSACQAKGEAA